MDSKNVKYPVYIISKGRSQNPITAKHFLRDGLDFLIAVEPQEYESYLKSIPQKNILVLPFSNLGKGSYPARNYCWEHSIKNGHKKHHLFDDNIYGFDFFKKGKRIKCNSVDPIVCLETFTDKFANVGISGFNYDGFVTPATKKPYQINTHVYSGMLIDNGLPFRWRMKYNEDVDLCLQVLHSGLCTILLNIYSINKVSTTSKLKGGNQDELYKNNDEKMKALKSLSLQKMWKQYVKVTYRYGRPHHQVSWKRHFKQPLIMKKGY